MANIRSDETPTEMDKLAKSMVNPKIQPCTSCRYCTGCGACEAVCPQSLKIPEVMDDLVKLLQ